MTDKRAQCVAEKEARMNAARARKLAAKIARELMPESAQKLVPKGYVYNPKQKKRRIPIGPALSWRLTYSEVMGWDHGSLHYQAVRALALHIPMMVMDCLAGYCRGRFGADHGHDVFHDVLTDVYGRAERDLRKSQYHKQTDKRKAHRKSERFKEADILQTRTILALANEADDSAS